MKLCECGCGQPAPISTKNDKRYNWVKGQPKRFIHGHQYSRRSCQVVEDGVVCGGRLDGQGLCAKHYTRLRRHGNVYANNSSHAWVGDDATYRTVHRRVEELRGKASQYACVDCGQPARQWSYDGTDPNEKRNPKTGSPFSTDLGRYDPRCVPCHIRKDNLTPT